MWFDWRTVLQISVLPAVIMGIAFIPMVKRIGPAPNHRFDLAGLMALLRRWKTPLGVGLIAFAVIYNMSTVAAIAMTPLYLRTEHGLSTVALLPLNRECHPSREYRANAPCRF